MSATPTVGWIGLGAIGAPMARAAATAGLPVTAFDLNPAALTALADVATPAASAAEAATGADVVVLMVATPPSSRRCCTASTASPAPSPRRRPC